MTPSEAPRPAEAPTPFEAPRPVEASRPAVAPTPFEARLETPLSPTSTLYDSDPPHEPKKLVLCFDGTGNQFSGSSGDTNVVKLLNKLDRNAPNQYHYYQTGIGTYDVNETTVHKSMFGEFCSSISQTIDQGIGTTFDAHLMAGYRFLMRYYDSGDKIYIFGFSRGAFTARFLSRMVHTVGLLCKGNEEMVPFAYRLYQRYRRGEIQLCKKGKKRGKVAEEKSKSKDSDEDDEDTEVDDDDTDDDDDDDSEEDGGRHWHWPHPRRRRRTGKNEITAFSDTFCRKEQVHHQGWIEERNIKVYFLGIWDCVNSVSVMESRTPLPVPITGTAHYVRHAVGVDERRVKFKPALLAQDIRAAELSHIHEDIKEVWFPGCHGDIGGGWPAADLDTHGEPKGLSIWQRIKGFWTTNRAKQASKNVLKDPFQMSDIPLAWMIREVELVGKKDPAAAVKWRSNAAGFKERFRKRKDQALKAVMHDTLQFNRGTGFFTVLLWRFMEWFPFITRWELEKNEWVNVRFPLNAGATRDIPPDAVLHSSLLWRLRNDPSYRPQNNHGDELVPCLVHDGHVADVEEVEDRKGEPPDPDHKTYRFTKQHKLEKSFSW